MHHEEAEMEYTNEMCPYVYIRKPSLLLGVIQCMLGATGFLLFPWLPGTTNLWLIALLLVFILQLIQNMYYDTRIHGTLLPRRTGTENARQIRPKYRSLKAVR